MSPATPNAGSTQRLKRLVLKQLISRRIARPLADATLSEVKGWFVAETDSDVMTALMALLADDEAPVEWAKPARTVWLTDIVDAKAYHDDLLDDYPHWFGP